MQSFEYNKLIIEGWRVYFIIITSLVIRITAQKRKTKKVNCKNTKYIMGKFQLTIKYKN